MKLPEQKGKTVVILHGFLLLLFQWYGQLLCPGCPLRVLQLMMRLKANMNRLKTLVYFGLGIKSELITC